MRYQAALRSDDLEIVQRFFISKLIAEKEFTAFRSAGIGSMAMQVASEMEE